MKSIIVRRPRRQRKFYFRLTERSEGCGVCDACRARAEQHSALIDEVRPFAEQAESERPGHVWTITVDKTLIFIEDLVMEKHLGRKLAKNEAVVHKNQCPSDNRLENLELIVMGSLEEK